MERNGSDRAQLLGRGLGRWLLGPSGLVLHLGAFLLGAMLLTLLNLLRSPGEIWFWRPLAWWGGLLAVHAGLTVGGAVRTAGARGSSPLEEHRAASPRSRSASGGSRLRGGLAARAGTLASFPSGNSATAATRRGDAGSPPDGWTLEDDAAFASWAEATDTWSAPRSDVVPMDANGEARRSPAPDGEGGPAPRDGMSNGWGRAANSADHAVVDRASGSPPATGRFLADGSTRPGRATGPASEVVTEEWVPADVAALWGAATSAPHAAETAALPVAPTRPTVSADGATAAAERRYGRPNGRDVVLNGPVPIDPNDPQWTRLEAAAEAWLARRETGPAPTPLRPPPVPTGTGHASTSQA